MRGVLERGHREQASASVLGREPARERVDGLPSALGHRRQRLGELGLGSEMLVKPSSRVRAPFLDMFFLNAFLVAMFTWASMLTDALTQAALFRWRLAG